MPKTRLHAETTVQSHPAIRSLRHLRCCSGGISPRESEFNCRVCCGCETGMRGLHHAHRLSLSRWRLRLPASESYSGGEAQSDQGWVYALQGVRWEWMLMTHAATRTH